MLARLGDRAHLVLAIDDLQWGDLDSAALLNDLLRPPDPPLLLLLASYRSEDSATSPFLQAFLQQPPWRRRDVAVGALPPSAARELALALLHRRDATGRAEADVIARESGGNPFFVQELAQHFQDLGEPHEAITLDRVLWARIERLPAEARRLLEIVAVGGGPLRETDAWQAVEPAARDRSHLALLHAGRLVRSQGLGEQTSFEAYHDRIRDTVLSHLSPDALRENHGRLARALEVSGQADAEALATHFRGAGELEQASAYFNQAAARAAEALAFDRAARLYQLALLPTLPVERRRELHRCRGEALSHAGRGADAAREYLQAAQNAGSADALELRRHAAAQLLLSGHIDEGLSVINSVLHAADLRLPKTRWRAVASILWQRWWLWWRGLEFRDRAEAECSRDELLRLDTLHALCLGFSHLDPVLSLSFHLQHLRSALRTGEPSRRLVVNP